MNPYWGVDLISFIQLVFKRALLCISGQLCFEEAVCDELQIFILILIAISASILSPFLVLKRKTMMANSLSHTSLLGLVLSYLFFTLFFKTHLTFYHPVILFSASIVSALLTTFLTDLCQKKLKLQEEASVALSFTFLFALGLILVALFTKQVHAGIEVIMGNIDAIQVVDVKVCAFVTSINLAFIILFFNYYKIFAFDEVLAASVKGRPKLIHYLLMLQTSLTAFSAFRAVGVFLFLIFLTAPFLAAKLVAKEIKKMIGYSIGFSVLAILLSVGLSRHLLSVYDCPLSTGALSCCFVALIYPFVSLIVWSKQRLLSYQLREKKPFKEELI